MSQAARGGELAGAGYQREPYPLHTLTAMLGVLRAEALEVSDMLALAQARKGEGAGQCAH